MRIRDAHAIVTGGSQGIGLATARVLASRGARVSLIARDEARLEQAATAVGPETKQASADVTDAAAVDAAVAALVGEQGPCDLLVTAAGAARPGYFEQLAASDFRAQMDLNYFGTLHPIRAVLGSMLERGSGTIVGISSGAALVGVFGYGAYSPSKYAVRGLMDGLRAEVGSRGVFVACAYPPDTLTPGFETENLTKPPETAAVSGGIKPKLAEEIGAGLVRGIERDRHVITFDPQTALLARGGGLIAPLVYRVMDREVRKAAPTYTAVTAPHEELRPMAIYDVKVNRLDGSPASLGDYKGKAVLIVNVASQCGLTPQYEGLEKLHETLGGRGFEVLGFPCNQFMGQEPGTAEEIQQFCSTSYGVEFPLFEKIEVNGEGQHPLYQQLNAVADGEGYTGDIRWNFEKFLVSPQGEVVGRFNPTVTPEDPALVSAIEEQLPS